MTDFEPVIVAFCCHYCAYTAADMAGSKRLCYPPNVKIVRVPCSGRVDAIYLMKALENGADGVYVAGCLEGDCHFKNGNIKAAKRVAHVKKLLEEIGLDGDRVEMVAMSAGMITNCIVYGNGPDETRFTTNNLDVTGGVVAYTCSMPRPAGTGNLGADPRFKALDAGDYHLRALTPCRRAGVGLVEYASDLDGVTRRAGQPYDLGCYAAGTDTTLFMLR